MGTRIVAETLIGLLDARSELRPLGLPELAADPRNAQGDFGIVDLLRIAGARGTEG